MLVNDSCNLYIFNPVSNVQVISLPEKRVNVNLKPTWAMFEMNEKNCKAMGKCQLDTKNDTVLPSPLTKSLLASRH